MTDFVLLSTADWDHPLWTNKQHLACSLADLGHVDAMCQRLGQYGCVGLQRDRVVLVEAYAHQRALVVWGQVSFVIACFAGEVGLGN